MKKNFIWIMSPITLGVAILLDAAVLGFGIFAIIKLTQVQNARVIFFAAVVALAIIVGFLYTKEVFKNGIIFHEDEFEFTGIDEKNVFSYDDISQIETYQDTAASLKKNFIDRSALMIITLKDKSIYTINIGLTTKGTLQKIRKELKKYIEPEKVTHREVKRATSAKSKDSDEKENNEES